MHRAILFSLLMIGCSSASTPEDAPPTDMDMPKGDPLSWTVTKPGPFLCGHRQVDLTYQPLGGLPMRTIPVHFWYPATQQTEDHPVYINIFTDNNAWEEAPLAVPAYPAGMPVLVHGHGYQGFAGNSASLMCHFATHGWLAVAPEHVGNTLVDTPDKLPLSVYVHRPLDLRAALDFAATTYAGKIDLGHVAMSGHSFGSYDMWVAAGAKLKSELARAHCTAGDITDCTDAQIAVFDGDLSEPRTKIVMPLAGASSDFMDDTGHDSARVPVLMMSGSLNDVGDGPLYAKSKGIDLTWVDVDGGCHQLFGLGNHVLGDSSCAALPDEEGFAIVNPWILAYARYYVFADRSAEVRGIVEDTASISPRVHVQHKHP